MKKFIIFASVTVVIAAAIFWYVKSRNTGPAISFATAKAEYSYIGKSVTATGTVQPVDTVSVGTSIRSG